MSDSHLKSEPMEISAMDFESEILQLCMQYPNGVSHKIVQNTFPQISAEECLKTINHLSSLRKIDILKSSTEPGVFFYRIHDSKESSDPMEKTVYQIVKESGNLGIWTRDVRVKTQLSPTLLNKTLKSLESQKLIKAVKSVHANKKKVYMLYELAPDPSITGGIWYSENEFEAEFVRVLNEQCSRLLDERWEESIRKYPHDPFLQRTQSLIASTELVSLINDMGIANVTLTVGEIELILDTLIYDGKVEKVIVASAKSNLYRSIKPLITSTPIARTSCGICPIFHDCHDDGLITPLTCIYLKNWLDF